MSLGAVTFTASCAWGNLHGHMQFVSTRSATCLSRVKECICLDRIYASPLREVHVGAQDLPPRYPAALAELWRNIVYNFSLSFFDYFAIPFTVYRVEITIAITEAFVDLSNAQSFVTLS